MGLFGRAAWYLFASVSLWALVACNSSRRGSVPRADGATTVDTGTRPPPTTPVYDPCDETSSCDEESDDCYSLTVDHGSHTATDSFCSLVCTHERDCPFPFWAVDEPACLELTGEGLCFARCTRDEECSRGFACVTATVDASVCLPI